MKLTSTTIIEVQTLNGDQQELTLGTTMGSQLPGRVDESGELQYDIMIVNPAVLDLLDILQQSKSAGANPVVNGNPLMEGAGDLQIEWKNKVVPVGRIEWVPRAAIGAAVIKFTNTSDTNAISGYKLENFELLGIINLIDARIQQ